MLYADDDDQSLKTPVVHPNDILDIEASPVINTVSSSWQYGFDSQGTPQEAQSKPQVKKATDHNFNYVLRARSDSPMKRGDPFLPSVFPDENPIADYNVKKGSRKKPSDCKCKGFGYNLSPSALLPEEMRQQWGVGMFGKATLPKSSIITSTSTCITKDTDPKGTQANIARNTSSNCVLRCKNCMREPCICTDICTTQHDGFRIPETSATRKQKHSMKGPLPKGSENNNLGSVLLGSTNSALLLKKVTFYNGKDSTNTISTSSFHRNGSSSLPQNGHSLPATDLNGYGCGMSSLQSNRGGNRCRSLNGNISCSTKKFCYAGQEECAASSRARHRQQPVQPRRHVTSVSSPPVISITGLSMPSSTLEKSASMTRGGSQMLMMGSQGCACDSCRQRANLMSRMEELGFSTSHAQQMLPPFMLAASQRYQTATLRSALTSSGRYTPYNIPTYGYAHSSNTAYSSPERYQCSSPSLYDYSDSPGLKCQPLAGTPLSMAQEMSKIDTPYQDNENPTSPPFSGFGEDITDMSIKDTVDFFVSMKSPFVKFSSLTSSDACPGMCSSLCPGEQCLSPPNFSSRSSTWFCTTGTCASSYAMSPVRRESIYRESVTQKFDVADGQAPPMSLLYSSLVSDLEDELRCAIENIPTS